MSEKNTERTYSLDNLPQSRTDWARIDGMTEEEIERNAQEDPDNPPWTEEDFANAELVMPAAEKEPISIRLDADVLEYFRSTGPRYQTRINAVLKAYVRRRAKR